MSEDEKQDKDKQEQIERIKELGKTGKVKEAFDKKHGTDKDRK